MTDPCRAGRASVRALTAPYAAAGILALLLLEAAIAVAWCGIEKRARGALPRRRASQLGAAVRILLGCAGLVALIPPAPLLVVVGVGGPGILLAAAALGAATLGELVSAAPRDSWSDLASRPSASAVSRSR